jgi:hypothetical protein
MPAGAAAAGDAIVTAPSMALASSGAAKAIFHLMSDLLYWTVIAVIWRDSSPRL